VIKGEKEELKLVLSWVGGGIWKIWHRLEGKRITMK
jgi:hypothetical protein